MKSSRIKSESSMKSMLRLRILGTVILAFSIFFSSQVLAQLPARFYWKSLDGGNAIPLIVESINGNTNPFDPSHHILKDADISATLALLGYAHTFSLFDRSALVAIMMPVGDISSNVVLGGITSSQSARGFGDPMVEFDINVIGPKAQKNLADVMRYEPGFSVDLLADLALPIGEYNNDQTINLGQNRWYGRFGMPVIWQFGPWVPGRRTTLELLPSVWLFGNNNDYVGQTLETDPIFQLDAHITRDLAEALWASLDCVWFTGGKATINNVSGDNVNNLALGFTVGYTITDNLNLTFSYKSTINDNNPGDIQMDSFMVSLVFGWHPLIEGAKRLERGQ